MLSLLDFYFFYSLSTEKSKAKVGENIFLWCGWVGVQITSHCSLNQNFPPLLNVMGKTLKQLMDRETSTYFFFTVKQDSHMTSSHKFYRTAGVETVHTWDKNGTSQGWAGVIKSCKTMSLPPWGQDNHAGPKLEKRPRLVSCSTLALVQENEKQKSLSNSLK